MPIERFSMDGQPDESKFVLAPMLRGDGWVTAADVSNLIGKSVTQLPAMRRRGTGPHCEQHDRSWAYRPAAVVEWLNACATVPMEAGHDA
ncbi:hypothetical protein ABVV53_08760 [Novosphingobium sp. RD2P27]|uniref:DNA-binding protein n=1 Tax=Novosphingobium kalidii TaxID=3230299 RepID=A0ABV2D116_9SPHN